MPVERRLRLEIIKIYELQNKFQGTQSRLIEQEGKHRGGMLFSRSRDRRVVSATLEAGYWSLSFWNGTSSTTLSPFGFNRCFLPMVISPEVLYDTSTVQSPRACMKSPECAVNGSPARAQPLKRLSWCEWISNACLSLTLRMFSLRISTFCRFYFFFSFSKTQQSASKGKAYQSYAIGHCRCHSGELALCRHGLWNVTIQFDDSMVRTKGSSTEFWKFFHTRLHNFPCNPSLAAANRQQFIDEDLMTFENDLQIAFHVHSPLRWRFHFDCGKLSQPNSCFHRLCFFFLRNYLN